jgi:hypothetical protein
MESSNFRGYFQIYGYNEEIVSRDNVDKNDDSSAEGERRINAGGNRAEPPCAHASGARF